MKNQGQVETQLERFKSDLDELESNIVSKVVDREAYDLYYRTLRGQIHALEWVLGIKKKRND